MATIRRLVDKLPEPVAELRRPLMLAVVALAFGPLGLVAATALMAAQLYVVIVNARHARRRAIEAAALEGHELEAAARMALGRLGASQVTVMVGGSDPEVRAVPGDPPAISIGPDAVFFLADDPGLRDEQLTAVVAHELSHLQHHDGQAIEIACAVSYALVWFGGGAMLATGLALGPLSALAAILVACVLPEVAIWPVGWLSRRREIRADRAGAAATSPAAMSDFLRGVVTSAEAHQRLLRAIPLIDELDPALGDAVVDATQTRRITNVLAALDAIESRLDVERPGWRSERPGPAWWRRQLGLLRASHPPFEERIAALRRLRARTPEAAAA